MDHFKIEIKNKIQTVRFNNPKKKNALDRKAYYALAHILEEAATNEEVSCLVLTGSGDFFSSGNDLTQVIDPPQIGLSLHQPMISLVQAFIRFPKLLVGIVNGPAIGIAATVLALCDVLYASETAYFYTPFTALGLCGEGCSTVTFPRIFGTSKANEMLSLNYKMSAKEAEKYGFVSLVYKDEQEVWERLKQIENLPVGSIIANKKLTRRATINELEVANIHEALMLKERMESAEALEAMINFQMSRQSKSKL